jgi:GcrA cell cycle regulator
MRASFENMQRGDVVAKRAGGGLNRGARAGRRNNQPENRDALSRACRPPCPMSGITFEKTGKGRVKKCNRQTGQRSIQKRCGSFSRAACPFRELPTPSMRNSKTAYSRNAAIGRAKRMGFAGPDRPKDWPKQILSAEAPRLPKRRERLASESGRPMLESVEPVKLHCVEINSRHLSMLDLEPGDCRYPYGGNEEGEAITFCGHPRRQGTSYCGAHFYLTRGPDAAAERTAGTVSL